MGYWIQLAALVLGVAITPLLAQNAGIRGQITDPSGAVIAGSVLLLFVSIHASHDRTRTPTFGREGTLPKLDLMEEGLFLLSTVSSAFSA